ncbi:MAG: CBS domain-containing protein [Leptolyngbyaceae cyanobacterium SM1_3_5]|nr:CBS domain-containing protein [Leptolyngbyaceae cyanobacterium SM1_3_5]
MLLPSDSRSLSLAQVMERHPLKLTAETAMAEALQAMVQAKQSYVLVVENLQLIGIFTEKDVVKITAVQPSFHQLRLSDVMTRSIITIDQSHIDNVYHVLEQLRQHHIRHLPVMAEGEVVGVLTLQDIRAVLQPADLLKLRRVREVMTPAVIAIAPTDSLLKAAQRMAEQQVSCVIVLHQDQPIGILTERDIVRLRLQHADWSQVAVQQVMTAPVVTIAPNESLWTAHTVMQQQQTRRLVVADAAGLAGILTESDVVAALDPLELLHVISALQETVEMQATALAQGQAEQHRLAQALDRSESRYRQILSLVPDPISCFAPDATVTFANQAYCDYFGQDRQTVHTCKFTDFVIESDRHLPLTQIAALSAENPIGTVEHRVRNAQGEIRWQRWINQAVCDAAGKYRRISIDRARHYDRTAASRRTHHLETAL